MLKYKKLLIIVIIIMTIISLFKIYEMNNVRNSKLELYGEIDKFVESLYTTYNHYGILGGIEHTVITSDSLYKISPIGRLINIRIEKVVDDIVYQDLEKSLKEYYKNNIKVNLVYICNAGTIMIDCRNKN